MDAIGIHAGAGSQGIPAVAVPPRCGNAGWAEAIVPQRIVVVGAGWRCWFIYAGNGLCLGWKWMGER